jgi:hypothetical protein
MEFDDQGLIKPVKITFEGVPPQRIETATSSSALTGNDGSAKTN